MIVQGVGETGCLAEGHRSRRHQSGARNSKRHKESRSELFLTADARSGSRPVIGRCLRDVRYPPNSSAKAEIPALQLRANHRHRPYSIAWSAVASSTGGIRLS